MTATATLSSKFQISIPKAVREQQHWEAGQDFVFIPGQGSPDRTRPGTGRLGGHRQGSQPGRLSRPYGPLLMTVLRVVDTSAWIEWLIASPLGAATGKQFPDKARCVVPTVVQLELSKWLVREVSEDKANQVIAYTQKYMVVPLDTAIALLAADLHRTHKLATAHAIVYATAQQMGAELITCDAHFQGLAGVLFFPKD